MMFTFGGGGGSSGAGAGGTYAGGGGGTYTGAGAIPLLVLIVMMDPGIVLPVGVVPTTAPFLAWLLIGVGLSDTRNPASCRRFRAASTVMPATPGTTPPGPPLT